MFIRMVKLTYVDRHLINVNPLLDTKLWYKDVESSIKNADHSSLANNRSVSLSEVGN